MDIVQVLKALADENRVRILNLLRTGELCVCDIETVLDLQQSNASRHLNKLKLAGIINSRKKSPWVYFRLNEETLVKFPFLTMIINDEIEKLPVCKDDLALLKKHKCTGTTC